jgi:hypothetical protein
MFWGFVGIGVVWVTDMALWYGSEVGSEVVCRGACSVGFHRLGCVGIVNGL